MNTLVTSGTEKKYNAETHATINGKFSDGPTGVYRSSPLAVAKAVKNEAEIEGMRNSQLRDAAALAEFWAWLEDEILKGATITEVEITDQLLEFRSKQDGFMDTSFDTISGSTGASVTCTAFSKNFTCVTSFALFLEYIEAMLFKSLVVSDMFPFNGRVSDQLCTYAHIKLVGSLFCKGDDNNERLFNACVRIPSYFHVQVFDIDAAPMPNEFINTSHPFRGGHIALDQAVFPENTPGFVLDAFARASLWKVGLDYRGVFSTFKYHIIKLVYLSLLSMAEIHWLNDLS
ncbi:hypothetical protein Dimus_014862 [Dionaea muscipula]